MRLMERISDRLLGMVVPEITASAGCIPDNYQVECSCKNGTIYAKTCSLNGACKQFCGSCYNTYIGCKG
jgi:hypothetical protein